MAPPRRGRPNAVPVRRGEPDLAPSTTTARSRAEPAPEAFTNRRCQHQTWLHALGAAATVRLPRREPPPARDGPPPATPPNVMRKLVSILSLAAVLSGCTWENWKSVPPEQAQLGIKPVAQLEAGYKSDRAWNDVRRRIDGLTNSLQRDLSGVFTTIDRYLLQLLPVRPVREPPDQRELPVGHVVRGRHRRRWLGPAVDSGSLRVRSGKHLAR